ncbi:PRTRC system ThiF family protein [Flavobacterium sp. F-65]|uniref:PRTRC system ThiF family protein n=1 Tax=Flavobacterium pisciphilum TaxID=2893755 RepID=A0ABS8MXP4_9FLAO|nr:PRTRC system ThiF family protein [Flavobacterium sp. F-65]MCC9073549.1 PRTRC system ThiF family protein [Flavobacterium sp. F-65]
MNTLKPMHYADNYLINPTNPITINLIGAGGTGSRMLTELARMNHSLIALGHTGLQVSLYDDDRITQANQGRQLFADTEVGLYKSVALINRTNRFFGTNWKAITEQFSTVNLKSLPNRGKANMYISCIDTVSARFDIAKALQDCTENSSWERNKSLYWLDLGNSQNTGQAILSTIGEIRQPKSKLYRTVANLPMVTDEFKELLEAQTENNEPSCSLAEALEKQDLFINTTLASMGASLLWKLFREGMTAHRGFFWNLGNFRSEPILVG